jgi:hypothetical protein
MRYFALLLLVLLSSASFAVNRVLTYGPSVVELTGTLDLQTFPGPPSYESIAGGDEIERHFYLKLDQPIDVLVRGQNAGIENAEEERNVKIVQLSVSEEKLWARFRKIGEGGRVKLLGTLFHRFNGHHHSRVLMIVNDMQAE